MNAENSPQPELNPADVAACAYLIWEREGKPHGRDAEHWMQAETLLRAMQAAEDKAAQESTKTASTSKLAPMARKRKAMRAVQQERQGATEG